MSTFEKLLSLFRVDDEIYHSVREEMNEENRRMLIVGSAFGFIAFLAMSIVSMQISAISMKVPVYIVSMVICGTIFALVTFFGETSKKLSPPLVGMFMFVITFYGISLGTIFDPHNLTVSYNVMIMAVPMFFCGRPARTNFWIGVNLLTYVILAKITQSPELFRNNLLNVIPFGFLSMFTSAFMMRTKLRKLALEKENAYMSTHDQLTGLYNRRSFDNHMNEISAQRCTLPITMIEIDLNGLKKVNDEIGHHAGDEVIRGTAECIGKVFGEYGECFRTGGDEFIVLVEGKEIDCEVLTAKVTEMGRQWKGEYISVIRMSIGYSVAKKYEQTETLMLETDKSMYKAKAQYYSETGCDRRRR